MEIKSPQSALDIFFVRHVVGLRDMMRIIFGVIWGVDAYFMFMPGFAKNFPTKIMEVAVSQPSWLSGWFTFWANTTASNPLFFTYSIAVLEILLAISLIFGVARKIGYGGGFILSLVIWSVPQGFGYAYGPTATNIGTGIMYALIFLLFAILDATYEPTRYSLDYVIEKSVKWWYKIAEVKSIWLSLD